MTATELQATPDLPLGRQNPLERRNRSGSDRHDEPDHQHAPLGWHVHFRVRFGHFKTDLTRAMVNGANLAVNPRKTVLTDANGAPYVEIDDLLDFRIGGIVRQTRQDALGVEPTHSTPAQILPVLSYVDDMAEKRTGVSKQQGLDSNALRNDRTAAEVMMTANAAKQRVKLIARIFAETLVSRYFRHPQVADRWNHAAAGIPPARRVREYDPNEWRDQYDMTVNVGLGTGDKR